MLIYGEFGVGKTLLTGQADQVPEMRKVLFIDVEGGMLSLQDFPSIDVVRVKSWDEMQKLYDALYAGGHDYRTVVIDSLTEMQKFNMDQVMINMLKKAEDGDKERDPDLPGLQEWNKSATQIRRSVRAFRDLPVNTIFTSLVKEGKDRMNRPIKTLDLPGQLARQVPAMLDYVWFYYKKEVPLDPEDADNTRTRTARCLLTQGVPNTMAKSRIGMNGKLPVVVQDPTMQYIFDMITRKEETK